MWRSFTRVSHPMRRGQKTDHHDEQGAGCFLAFALLVVWSTVSNSRHNVSHCVARSEAREIEVELGPRSTAVQQSNGLPSAARHEHSHGSTPVYGLSQSYDVFKFHSVVLRCRSTKHGRRSSCRHGRLSWRIPLLY